MSDTAHVVFDFDGTLVDSLGLLVSAYNAIAEKKRLRPMTLSALGELQRMHPRERLKYLGVRWYQLPFLAREMKRVWQAELPKLKSFPGIDALLANLKARGTPVGVISSNSAENIQAFAAQSQWPGFVDVRSARLHGKHRTLASYMRVHSLTPEEVLYVGDELRDSIACKRAGVRMIAVTWGADLKDHFSTHPPLAFAETVHALEALLVSSLRGSGAHQVPIGTVDAERGAQSGQ